MTQLQMTNTWAGFCSEYSKKHNMSFKQAMQSKGCRDEWVKYKPKRDPEEDKKIKREKARERRAHKKEVNNALKEVVNKEPNEKSKKEEVKEEVNDKVNDKVPVSKVDIKDSQSFSTEEVAEIRRLLTKKKPGRPKNNELKF